jgi:putative FmdB family regulatory protein
MPLYDYNCDACGTFTLSRSVAERDIPAACPECQSKTARILSAPNLSLMPTGRRLAFARNEKSQHEPGIKTRHRCGTGCGCGSSTGNSRTRTVDLGKVGKFEISRKQKRPWMLGH